MLNIIPYYKPLGLSPLQAIDKLKSEKPELANTPITFAGRLDPMAEGLILLLHGDAISKKQELLDLPKTYEAKILLGFDSDTFDILGIAGHEDVQRKTQKEINIAVQSLVGSHSFPYPNYSSKTVDGKPLWLHARDGNLNNIEIPTREMTVHSVEITNVQSVVWQEIYKTIISSVALVYGEFRQTEIVSKWDEINKTLSPSQEFQIINITFVVSSGTYIRTLANELGKLLNTKALLYHLKRTKIGDFKIIPE